MPLPQENNWELCSRDYAQVGSITGDAGVSGYPVANMIDGDRGTFYKKAATSGVMTLDLGVARTIDRLLVRCPFFYGVQTLTIEMSTNGSTWTLLPAVPYGTVQSSVHVFVAQVMRYIKVSVLTLPAGVTELRICQLAAFKCQYELDGYRTTSPSSGMLKKMPYNPTTGRTIGFTGRVMVPLMHGANFRVQEWGSQRRTMTFSFPMVLREFVDLLGWYMDRGTAFGILDHEFDFWNAFIIPGGLRPVELPSDGAGAADAPTPGPERVYPSKSWYSVEVDVQECASSDAVTEEEAPAVAEPGEIIMTETVEVP